MMKVRRNDPCPCGSGKKYKQCCLIKGTKSRDFQVKVVFGGLGVLLVLGGMVPLKEFSEADPNSALPGPVWSEEHGHWHTVSPGGSGTATRPISQPGPAPPGKVWSAEHGHWHDAAPEATPEGSGTATTPQSP